MVSVATVARLHRDAGLDCSRVMGDGHTRLRWPIDHAGARWHEVCHTPTLRNRPRAGAAAIGAGVVTREEMVDTIEAQQDPCEVVDYLRWRLAAIDSPP